MKLQRGGLLGYAYQKPKPEDQYAQMAAPYAQWAAQQLKQYAPETQVPEIQPQNQWNDAQQQALAQMWNSFQNQNYNNQSW